MNKKEYNTVLAERANDLNTLIHYYCVTRVMNCEAYQRSGFFDYKRFSKSKNFLGYWKSKPESFKLAQKNLSQYWNTRSTYNKVLGIPSKLLWSVLSQYQGKRFSLEEVLMLIGGYQYTDKNGKVVVVGGGKWKIDYYGQDSYTKNGVRIIKEVWDTKIYPADKTYWLNLFKSGNYDNLETMPNASKRVIGIINRWNEKSEKKVMERIRQFIELIDSGRLTITKLEAILIDKDVQPYKRRKIMEQVKEYIENRN